LLTEELVAYRYREGRREAPLMTAEQFVGYEIPGKRVELIAGRVFVREYARPQHGAIAAEILIEIGIYLRATPIGVVFAESGFHIERNPDTVRAPDVAYVAGARGFAARDQAMWGSGAPDLCVEVVSPNDRLTRVAQKARQWIATGAQLVWVVDPRRRCATVYRADGSTEQLTPGDSLRGDDLLPGFTLPLKDVLL
jgi:Uma2 family endonuclease